MRIAVSTETLQRTQHTKWLTPENPRYATKVQAICLLFCAEINLGLSPSGGWGGGAQFEGVWEQGTEGMSEPKQTV